MSQTLLGICDGYMPAARNALTSETKIGGTATYLPELSEAQRAQIKAWTSCGVCGRPMALLLQAYSPLPSSRGPHHRMLYVFACNSASCCRQPSSSWVAFSLQVDQEDEAAEAEDTEEGAEPLEEPLRPSELPVNTLPPCYVYIDVEPAKEIVVPTDVERELIRMAEENAKSGANGIAEADLKEIEATIDLKDKRSDYYYEKFRSRVAREPHQVLRYHQRDSATPARSAGGPLAVVSGPAVNKQHRPLFMNPEKVKRFFTVPACASCGAALVHEVQLLPTAIYFLRTKDYVSAIGDEGLDFGTATVYVCSRDCAAIHTGVYLRKEVIFVEEPPTLRDDTIMDQSDTRKSMRELMGAIDADDEDDEALPRER